MNKFTTTIDVETLFEFPASSIHYLTAQVDFWNAQRDGRKDRAAAAHSRGKQALRKLAATRRSRREELEAELAAATVLYDARWRSGTKEAP